MSVKCWCCEGTGKLASDPELELSEAILAACRAVHADTEGVGPLHGFRTVFMPAIHDNLVTNARQCLLEDVSGGAAAPPVGTHLNLALPGEWTWGKRGPGPARIAAYFARRWGLELANPGPGAPGEPHAYRAPELLGPGRWAKCPDCGGRKPLLLTGGKCWCDLS